MLLARKKKSSICNSFISLTFDFKKYCLTTARYRWLHWAAFYGAGDVEVEKPPWPGGEDQEGVEPKSCRHKILMTHWADKLGKERCLTEIVKYVFGKEAKTWTYSSRLAVRLPTIQALLGNPGGQWSSLSALSLSFMKSTPRANSCESCRGLSTSLICTGTSTGELAWNNLQWRGISVRVESCKEA